LSGSGAGHSSLWLLDSGHMVRLDLGKELWRPRLSVEHWVCTPFAGTQNHRKGTVAVEENEQAERGRGKRLKQDCRFVVEAKLQTVLSLDTADTRRRPLVAGKREVVELAEERLVVGVNRQLVGENTQTVLFLGMADTRRRPLVAEKQGVVEIAGQALVVGVDRQLAVENMHHTQVVGELKIEELEVQGCIRAEVVAIAEVACHKVVCHKVAGELVESMKHTLGDPSRRLR